MTTAVYPWNPAASPYPMDQVHSCRERIWVLCRAGISAEDFSGHIGELAAACYARDARVTRNRQWSYLVTIDSIRRDTLAASNAITSQLARHALIVGEAPGRATGIDACDRTACLACRAVQICAVPKAEEVPACANRGHQGRREVLTAGPRLDEK